MQLDNILNGDKRQIETIYTNYRAEFISWIAKNYNCSTNDAVEVYHHAVVTFYENIISSKIKALDCSIKTYLFAIGRNKYLEKVKAQKKYDQNCNENVLINLPDAQNIGAMFREQQLESVDRALEKLGEPGRTILELFYYHGKSMEEITELLHYKNRATAKNLKYKYLLRLKKIVEEEQTVTQSMYYD